MAASLKQKITDIALRYKISDLYVFGSRSREIAESISKTGLGGSASESDVDMGILPKGNETWSPEKLVALSLELEDTLKVNRLDLVLLPQASPYLALDIIRGELLYAEDPDQQARYELFVLRRAADLLPFKKERNRMILEGRAR